MNMFIPSHTVFFAFIREKYGREMLALVWKVSHLAFNSRCKRYQLIPRCLQVKPLVQSHEGKRIAECASCQFLCAQIKHNHPVARRLELDLCFRRQVLTETLRRDKLAVLVLLSAEVQNNEQEKCKPRHKCNLTPS